LFAIGAGLIAAGLSWICSLRHPLAMAVAGLAAMMAIALAASWVLNARWDSLGHVQRLTNELRSRRRTYAGYTMHVALASLAVGVAGSSLGTRQYEATLAKGESIHWAGRDVHFVDVLQTRLPEKLVVQAELEVTVAGAVPYTLRPAQEFYFLQNEWSTEVAIHSTWSDDFYTILHSGEGQDRIRLTLRENPLMRWMWLAGWIMAAGAVPWFWPTIKRASQKFVERDAVTDRRRPAIAQTSAGNLRRRAA
jgi:cytochrome c biogenesis factor